MKRQRIEIIAQILAFCIRGRQKTRIMYGNNLSHAQLNTYLTFLTSRDLLAHKSDRYVTTKKGHRFLEAFAQLNDVLENREHRAFVEIINELGESGSRPHEVNSQVGRRTRANQGQESRDSGPHQPSA